jgi:hypothetical protein
MNGVYQVSLNFSSATRKIFTQEATALSSHIIKVGSWSHHFFGEMQQRNMTEGRSGFV